MKQHARATGSIWWAPLLLIALLVACDFKRPVTPPPAVQPGQPGAPGAREVTGALDPALIQKEIQRRQAAVVSARNARAGLSKERQAVLDGWILALEDEAKRLKEIQDEMRGLPPTNDPVERARRSQRVAARLLECVALDPLEPPVAAPVRLTEETRVSWEPLRLAYGRGDCITVAREHEGMAKAHLGAPAPTDVDAMRAICLGRTGKRQEAIRLLEPLLKGSQVVDSQQLQYLLANWLYEEGQSDRAGERYQALLEGSKERDRWSDLAKIRLEQIRLRTGETSPATPGAGPPERASPPGLLPQTEPQPLVTVAPPGALPAPPVPLPDRVSEPIPGIPPAVTQPGATPPPEKQPEPSPQELYTARLQEAQRLLDSEKYEEAIQIFQGLQGTQVEVQAQKGIQEAQDRYAEKRRVEARDLVLEAREEKNPAKKKARLAQALGILQDANGRYPNNRYAAKIQQNIQDVTSQIRVIDPGFRP
jgi:tetratricopeptide (TPR) repeat protein